jgi:heterotetrameric sarcosine oxidase delta subunit
MIIDHPILGPRDAQEFVYLGDANLIHRPDGLTASMEAFHDYAYLRDNPAGQHRELWTVELARDVARAEGRSK